MARKNKNNNSKKSGKSGKSGKNRSSQKIIDAYQIAERQERRNQGGDDIEEDEGNFANSLAFEEGILDARSLLKDGQADEDLLDEEIDSDEALGSDDDYDVLDSKMSQSIRDKAKRKRLGQYSDSEDEEDDDDDDDEGYASIDESQLVTLSEAWDMDDRDLASVQGKGHKDIVLNDDWESESSSSEESSEDEGEDGVEEDWGETSKDFDAEGDDDDNDENSEEESDDDDDDDDEEEEEEEGDDSDEENVFSHDSADDEGLDLAKTTKRLQKELEAAKPKERKRFIVEKRDENEFNVPSGGQSLSIAEMMQGIQNAENEAILIDADAKAVATPLPKRIQQRNDRGAAYNLSKKEVSKWSDTVQQNRQAELLKFPMQQPDTFNDSANAFRSNPNKEKTETELEKNVNDILAKSSLIDDKKEATFEEIAVAKMSAEELRERTNQLRLMRELMFRDERRAKRLKKIKSKQYHKIKKKERLRNQELVDEAEDVSDDEDAEDKDMKRAEERMSLRHKTQSKWAQSMIKSGLSKDASNREELEEMLRQGERLREKQLGLRNGEDDVYDDEGVSDIERDYEHDDADGDEDERRSKLGKGVMAMEFMKNAEQRRKEENLKTIEQLRRLQNGEDDGLDLFQDENDNGSVNITKNQGRRVYNPVAIDDSNINEEVLKEVEDEKVTGLAKKVNKANQVKIVEPTSASNDESKSKAEKNAQAVDDEANPWLSIGSESGATNHEPQQKSSKVTVVDENSSKFAKAAMKIAKKSRKQRRGEGEDLIDINETLAVKDIHNDGSDVSDSEATGESSTAPKMFKQKDLIKEAFVGDDVVAEFENEKKRMIEDEDDKEEDITLPGWGDWVGGKSKPNANKKRKFIRKIDGVVQKDKRKDKNLKNVIINEKLNKKNLKYQARDVPYPFETREQYERSLQMPVGQEWTSRATHQRLTMPRVVTKQGMVIDPLKAPFK
ncbi:hypothetical protein PVL30_002467 [Lodderomyces elongisporus]|uniref:uncharacterized protein n=1 Tax=Lodderomyces elongisporus TaxID=36914 RepID=UPI0029251AE6|nr:uncharacterized protein PVL30_002467 [Lodderomyces elongisporus]WLF78725.1 hypothetical protein PVL30_002467 [Lodderomyces elongisporus]